MDRTFFVMIEGNEPIIIIVKNDVNRPKLLDCHSVLEKWVTDKNDFKPYDYWEIDTCEKHNI
ncbi:hypothetical protein [Cytobacillus purgationiresistens]|uniref:Uncharacterized protein n=1 Tax=Cytobacillus purgationiresistens TaxID=863449 RepID=A0ABU0ADS6_9BACI|nr:hypothetical protein [Cytobacillus purgationiresistens]MDQ0268896.1 hypothetical protein [Cytobacillus purgationiresistens]